MHHRSAMTWAGGLGATGILIGAFGAHSLAARLAALSMTAVWETAARYQLVHAVALAALAAWMRAAPASSATRRAGWAATLWTAGVILFSGSLYALALGAPRWTGAITPFGGLAMTAGWIFAIAAARRAD